MKSKSRAFFKRGQLRFMGDKNCSYCGVDLKSLPTKPHFDHVIPKSRGGSSQPNNLLLVCEWCNLHKHARSLETVRPVLIQKKIGWPQFTDEQLSWLRTSGFEMSPFDNGKFWFEDGKACGQNWEPRKRTKFQYPRRSNIFSAVLSFGV